MTSSAKARGAVIVTLLIAIMVGIGTAVWWFARKRPVLPQDEFATLHLADPIELTDGDTKYRVTRVVVNFKKETITLERDELAFDDYGDATRIGGDDPLTS